MPWRTGTIRSAGAPAIMTAPTKKPPKEAEQLLARAGRQLAPGLLHLYPAVIWRIRTNCPRSAARGRSRCEFGEFAPRRIKIVPFSPCRYNRA